MLLIPYATVGVHQLDNKHFSLLPTTQGLVMEGNDVWKAFCYDVAMVRGIASSLPDKALRQSGKVEVALQTAIQQHREYIEASFFINIFMRSISVSYFLQVLQKLVPEVLILPADAQYPDCVFIEDTAVVADGVALITIPGMV